MRALVLRAVWYEFGLLQLESFVSGDFSVYCADGEHLEYKESALGCTLADKMGKINVWIGDNETTLDMPDRLQ